MKNIIWISKKVQPLLVLPVKKDLYNIADHKRLREANIFLNHHNDAESDSHIFFLLTTRGKVAKKNYLPHEPFHNLELQKPSPDVPELHKIRRSPDHEALKL